MNIVKVQNYAMDSSKIKWVLSIRYLQNEFTLDIEVRVDASDRDHKILGPNTMAKLPDVIRLDDECSTTYKKDLIIQNEISK